MLQEMDWVEMEKNAKDIERITAKFLQKIASLGAKVIYLNKVDITANVANAVVEQW